jgi:hypothetical protein
MPPKLHKKLIISYAAYPISTASTISTICAVPTSSTLYAACAASETTAVSV